MLEQAQPERLGGTATVLDAMEQAETTLAARFSGLPGAAAYVTCAIARVYSSHEKISRAIELFEKALPVLTAGRGPGGYNIINSFNKLALAYAAAGDLERAHVSLSEAIVRAENLDHPGAEELRTTLRVNLAGQVLVPLGSLDEGLKQYDRSLKDARAQAGDHGEALHTIRVNRAQVLELLGRLDEAETDLRAALTDAQEAPGLDAPVVLAGKDNLRPFSLVKADWTTHPTPMPASPRPSSGCAARDRSGRATRG